MDEYQELRIFGDNLRKIREGHGLSQVKMAEISGISRAYYGRIERGEFAATVKICYRIADAVGVHISDLFIDLP